MMEEFKLHRANIAKFMDDKSILVLFASHDKEFKEAPNKNFYYATGIKETNDKAILIKNNGNVSARLFIQPYDEFKAKWVGKPLDKEEASNISGIEAISFIDSFEAVLAQFIMQGFTIYFDFVLDESEYQISEINGYANRLKEKYPYAIIKNGRGFLQSARTIKTPYEIEQIKKAIRITNEGIKALMKNAKAGLYEYQLESYFDQAIKFNGSDGYSFDTIAASGLNSCCLHYSSNDSIIKPNSLILFDLGSTYNHYCADISRTFPINGKFSERQKQIYNIVLNGQKLIFENAKPGITTKELNQILIKYYAVELKRIGLIKEDSEVSKYYYHGVSHHLGLDCHDLADYTPLQPGAVISNEPGLYILEEEIGIRIEDDVLITENGCINLSAEIIKSVEDIEAFMAK